ncbi:MAG: ABC transporter ATP-binding protein [Butyrivibrio sp.]|jgi:ATP-binding cassette subfamily B protein|nr:ABC transporter ATP-binding protein [Butyrivibrio sp.]
MAPEPKYKKDKPKNAKNTFLRLLKYSMEFKYILFAVLVLCLISNVLSLFGPSLAGKAINEAAAGAGRVNFKAVYGYAIKMLIFYVTSSLLSYIISVIMMHTGRHLARQLRKDVFDKLMSLPVSYYDRHQAGDIISRVSYDIDVVSTCFSTDIVQIMTNIVTVVGSLIMMLIISPPLVTITLITIPLAIAYTRYMGKKTRPLFSKRSAKYGQMNGFVEEMFSGQKTILAYAHEDAVIDDFDNINGEAADAFYQAEYYGMSTGPSVGFINNLGLSLICMFGSLLYLLGVVTVGQISSFILYSRKFSGPINEIANIITELFSAISAAERVFRLLDETEEPEDEPDAIELTDIQGNVELDHISFGYIPGIKIIKDFSLEAKAGQTVAIVGPTGAGKTTLINLLMRFYDIDSGKIRLDGHDISTITRKSLRSAYAMVLQDTWVFNGTVYDNIAYGSSDATMEKVVEAAKAARIHSFIKRLPKGYNTVIGEDGGNISKGQKQMLTIARAFLYDAPILILDEATSNVDTTTEKLIQDAMLRLMKGRTCFVIAHRLSTIQNADHIIVMNNGQIIEDGNHESLMNSKGFYYKLYESQFT